MRHAILFVVGFTLLATIASTQSTLGTAADRSAVLKFREAHNVAINNHDAKAVANLYALDGDRVSSSGVHFAGRAAIEQSYVTVFNGNYKNAAVKDESGAIKFLSPDVALVDVDDVITGLTGATTMARHHVASIYVKRNGKWEMVAERATNIQ